MAPCFKGGLLLYISFIFAGAEASLLGSYWKNLEKIAVAAQTPDDTCPVANAVNACHSAELVKGDSVNRIHVCRKDGML